MEVKYLGGEAAYWSVCGSQSVECTGECSVLIEMVGNEGKVSICEGKGNRGN